MKIGIIGPTENEIMPFVKSISDVKIVSTAMLKFYNGVYKNINVVALYCGVCKVNAAIATQILIDKFSVSHIIVVGVAGGIDKTLKIGDTVIATEIAYHDVDDGILTEYHPWMESIYFKSEAILIHYCKKALKQNKFEQTVSFGKIVTGESFIIQNGREEIILKYNPLCVDMETASIAHVCYVNEIPFLAIRSITDTEEECGIEAFEENCVDVSLNSIKILKALLEQLSYTF
ncbi:5'-methylthioadenosine/adenosylhomocysteine nucleosidase [Senegalia massiliensis]|uniref:adenosylhomocysteine nucleosidase n=1 Tax=Senegalia massiliensis TaxID=1720316 RepID=A0A845QYZ8_9CLOT|nr:5'-methylthioadenosine/adenosylhomocysteine nucleosidase [Senegalia massiliensis]NBI05603.1 5'-methylthioadenosine/adenosylhomocysteine nucleosidase [Senegalia massiliensis]